MAYNDNKNFANSMIISIDPFFFGSKEKIKKPKHVTVRIHIVARYAASLELALDVNRNDTYWKIINPGPLVLGT